MKQPTDPTRTPPYLGHVKDGVVIFDSDVSLRDGQAVRVEPLDELSGTSVDAEKAERVRRMRELFAHWTEEDAKLSDAEADLVRDALAQHGGLHLRATSLD